MRILSMQESLPWGMVLGRAVLGPFLILGQAAGWNGITLASMVLAGFLSDIYDGVLARRWRTDTDALRLADSMADIVFYLGTALALFHRCPELCHAHQLLILAMVAMEIERLALDLHRYGRPSSYHAWLSKAAGLLLSLAVIVAFAVSHRGSTSNRIADAMLLTALLVGLVSQIEGFAISLVLPLWRRDVHSLFAAVRLRRTIIRRCVRRLPKTSTHSSQLTEI